MSLPPLYLVIRCDEAVIFITEKKWRRREGRKGGVRKGGEGGETLSEKVNPDIKCGVALWLPQVHNPPSTQESSFLPFSFY